jgi:hypothetical protein
MLGEQVSFGGDSRSGFALGGPNDPSVFASLSSAQQTWIQAALVLLNTKIFQSTGSTCATWTDPGVNLAAAVACFQNWYNANYTPPKAPGITLRTDGVVDQDTISALQTIASLHPADFNAPFPGAVAPVPSSAAATPSKLSKGEMIGIGVAGAAVLGGIVYAATRGGGRRRSRSR